MKKEEAKQRSFRLRRLVYDFFKTIFGPSSLGLAPESKQEKVWIPPADLYQENGRWVARIELPGVNPNDLSLLTTDSGLILRGERKRSEALKSEYCILHECRYGPFERIITLPAPVPEDRIKASYRQGILYITFPATEEKGKKIEIQSEAPPEETPKAA